MTIILNALVERIEKKVHKESVVERAKEILASIVLPKTISRWVIEKYLRKAMQIHIWYRLDKIDRVLLILTRKLSRVKSSVFKSVLYRIFLKIGLFTARGKALFYGIILSMQNTMYKLHDLLKSIPRLLTIGLFYLNNLIIYRIWLDKTLSPYKTLGTIEF